MAVRRRDYKAEYARRQAGARTRGFQGYYGERLSRARARHPGISTGAARGHARPSERAVDRFLRQIRKLPPGSTVSFTGTDRQPDGTWNTARFDVFPGDGTDETTTTVTDLDRLAEIRDALAATGILVLGAKYLARMAQAVEEQLYAIRSSKTGRWLYGVGKKGQALTRRALDDRVLISPDARILERRLRGWKLARRGFAVVAL